MQFMYVDESGDPGVYTGSNSPHFILSGLILSETEWNRTLRELSDFKRYCRDTYGLPIGTELHASELIRIKSIDDYRKIRKADRLRLLEDFTQNVASIFRSGKVLNVCFDKKSHPKLAEFQTIAWTRLIQRYDTYLRKSVNDQGVIFADDTDEPLIRQLLRKMRAYNPVPNQYGGGYRMVPTDRILEDVIMKASDRSYFIQAADAVAHCLYRREYVKGSLRKFRVERYFDHLEPILLKKAAASDPLGIVRK